MRPRRSRARAAQGHLSLRGDEASFSVPAMPPRIPVHPLTLQQRRVAAASARRARRVVGLVLLAFVVLLTLVLTAFGSSPAPAIVRPAAIAHASRLLPAGPPAPQVVALHGDLRIQLPIAQREVTAIGYHAAGDGALRLDPLGRQVNQGLFGRLSERLFGAGGGRLRYYQLEGGAGPSTSALDVGAAPGTDVYSPVDGTVVGLTDYIVSRKRKGVRIDIQPATAPAVIVSLTHLRPRASLTVGSALVASSDRLGKVIDLTDVERQALARYTQDSGNHVVLEVHPAAALATP